MAYDKADVVVNPAVVGSGLKIKNIEALGRGKVLVITSHSGTVDGGLKSFIEFSKADVRLKPNNWKRLLA